MGWNVVVFEGLIRLAMVFRHLNAILTFVFLNMFVTLLIPYEQYYIQTLYREDKLIPKQSPGEKKTPISNGH